MPLKDTNQPAKFRMNKIDGEFGLDYQIFVLRRMIQQLPEDLSKTFEDQLNSVVLAYNDRMRILQSLVGTNLDDARLAILNIQFDLEATRRERDELRDEGENCDNRR